MIDLRNMVREDYWFDVGAHWCWRCWRFTRHFGHTQGKAECVRCALLRDGAEKDKEKRKARHL